MGILGWQSTILGSKKQGAPGMEVCYHNEVGVLVLDLKGRRAALKILYSVFPFSSNSHLKNNPILGYHITE